MSSEFEQEMAAREEQMHKELTSEMDAAIEGKDHANDQDRGAIADAIIDASLSFGRLKDALDLAVSRIAIRYRLADASLPELRKSLTDTVMEKLRQPEGSSATEGVRTVQETQGTKVRKSANFELKHGVVRSIDEQFEDAY